MSNKNLFNIIDLGSSKIRFAAFDKNLNEKFSDSIKVLIENDLQYHFEAINKIIRSTFNKKIK